VTFPTTQAPSTTIVGATTIPADQQARAEAIARADARVASILGSRAASVTGFVPWGSNDRTLGIVVKFQVASKPSPARIPSGSPHVVIIDKPASGGPYYTVSYPKSSVSGVTTIFVLVDLATNQVVSIEPGLSGHVTP
jgi:hypothetical protein